MVKRPIRFLAVAGILALALEATAQLPVAPLVKGVKDGSDVLLEWNDDPAAASFNVYRTDDLLAPPALIAAVLESSFRDVGAVPGPPVNPAQLFYVVRGIGVMGEGPASNVAFKLNRDMVHEWWNVVSLPYLYYPDGDLDNDTQNVLSACEDLSTGDCTVHRIAWVDKELGGIPKTHTCSSPVSFYDLRPGTLYWVILGWPSAPGCTIDIVGSHDNEYSLGGSSSLLLTGGLNQISIPYNIEATTPTELCAHLAEDNPGGELDHIIRHVPETKGFITQHCQSPIDLFELTPGEGLFLYLRPPPAEWVIQWRTH